MSKDLIEYFQNLELSQKIEPFIIDRIHDEIDDNYADLLFQCGHQLEKLISMSEYTHLKKMMKKIRLTTMKTKRGSHIWEAIFKRLKVLNKRVSFNWEDYFFDINATFSIRAYIELKVDLDAKKVIILERALKNIDKKEIMITFGIFIKLLNDQEFISRVIKSILTEENAYEMLSNPYFSYFFESILDISDKANLLLFFKMIEPSFEKLATDQYANYVIQKLILKLPSQIDNLKIPSSNSNILFCVIMGTKDYEKMKLLIKKNYGDVFKMIKRENSVDSKYYKLAIKLFTVPKEHSLGINEKFLENFELNWLYCRYGAEIVLGYLKGHENIENKNKFIKMCQNEFKNMCIKKCSQKILVQMSRVGDLKTRNIILEILRSCKKK
ncbi:hypothetical protein DMUE_4342 [Dictyocoela muelleri]|nr:hypothetical protein DMUE_4342 [Dictyocoela muelleri]